MLTELTAEVPNEAGRLLQVLNVLNVVNIQAFSIEEADGTSRIRIITNDLNAARYQLKSHKILFKPLDVIGIALEHKPGQLVKVATHLGENGINIEHGFLTLEMTRGRAIVFIRTSDIQKAEAVRILREANFELCDEIEEPLVALAAPLAGELDIHPKGDQKKLDGIIHTGESGYVEFKATMRWDIKTHIWNKDLGKDICVSISAFMNSRGGTLLIGVNDDGTIRGLHEDFKTCGKKQNEDGFGLAFSNLISSEETLGAEYYDFIDSYFKLIEGQKIFVVEVSKSPNPVWLNRGNDFYVRVQSADRRLNARQALSYIKAHWAD